MKVHVVICTEGDYIGYFESSVLGCFVNEKDAIECKNKAKQQSSIVKITIEYVEVQE